jgi:hypothetical protein
VLLCLEGAGKGLCDRRTFEEIGGGGGNARSRCEHVDGFEDEVAGKCAAEVGNTIFLSVQYILTISE